MPTIFSSRFFCFISLLAVSGLLAFAAYLQIHRGLNPCPLCLIQRGVFVLLALIFLIGALFKFEDIGRRVVGSLGTIAAGLGIVIAGRQVWLQHYPPLHNSDCGANLTYMIQVLPFKQVLELLFNGSGECTVVSWQFLSISIAEWSLISFCLFFLVSISLILRQE